MEKSSIKEEQGVKQQEEKIRTRLERLDETDKNR